MADTLTKILRRIPPWVIYVLGVAHIVWLFWLGMTGGLGAEPIKALQQELGQAGLKLLLVGLAITPIRKFTGVNLIRFRRAVGLTVFLYITVHLTVWLVLDLQSVARIWADIVKRPYITIGMSGFVLMVPLAMTSNDWSVGKLGLKWRLLHRLVYVVVVLGALHFVMLRKGFQIEPLIYLAVALGLLALRVKKTKRSTRAA